ncbi:DinB family protein [Desulfosporosinus sp. PR]|uniref:DinB family protein n=1 Tax=Candidatus Desulfosporosinus nitrosoreducens TaxID=3401928 RepID=UPI0027E9F43F|nr:DinB family protein [Desulfosporosinus sp. PR]MDQ7094573.1 DinB family protein [Desulfosporosinus sp. PR]
MDKIIERLNYLIEILPLKVNEFSEEEFSVKLSNKWSKKEILGHLCDSATNNHHRFIRIQFEVQPFVSTSYDQNNWVLIQDYQTISTVDIVDFWLALNRQIIRVISKLPEEKLSYQCSVGDNKSFTLLGLIQDYLRHMEHHLNQIFGTSDL